MRGEGEDPGSRMRSAGEVLEAAKGLATHSNNLSGQIEKFLKSLNAA